MAHSNSTDLGVGVKGGRGSVTFKVAGSPFWWSVERVVKVGRPLLAALIQRPRPLSRLRRQTRGRPVKGVSARGPITTTLGGRCDGVERSQTNPILGSGNPGTLA